jgi:hypothetical protein
VFRRSGWGDFIHLNDAAPDSDKKHAPYCETQMHPLRPGLRTAMLAALALTLVATSLRAASDSEMRPAATPKKSNDIMVPIPGWSPEVQSNGCRVRQSPDAVAPDHRPGRQVPFWALIDQAVGRHAVRATRNGQDAYVKKLAALDPELRGLTVLFTLQDNFGRDGLHTFFFTEGGNIAPAIRDGLKEGGFEREFELFGRAMAMIGTPYPVDREVRKRLFGYSRPGGNLNAFDHALLEVAKQFGTEEQLRARIAAHVNASPALFRHVESLRARLGEKARLRHLNDALSDKIDWNASADEIARALATLPREERHLVALFIFNMQFENGGVHQFFYNSSGDIAPEVHAAMIALGLAEQAELFNRGLNMFGDSYPRDNETRREKFFSGKWSTWDDMLSGLTDAFYALGGGARAYSIKGDLAFEGGPGIRDGMLAWARRHNMLPC